jgi:membrane protease YdiL (CAAX protease family)
MTTSTGTQSTAHADDTQYSLAKIMTIWAVVALPMLVLVFFVAPFLALYTDVHLILLVWYVAIVGMAWQFVVSMWILYQELDRFTWSAIKERIWLNKPSDPNTGKKSYKLFWWLIPSFIFILAIEMSPAGDYLDKILPSIFPSLNELNGADIEALLVPEMVGAWWLMWVAVLSSIFNYFLGEELLFRGILLPKMRGAFGKWDWVANAALFGLYHLHKPQNIIKVGISALGLTWGSRRFKSIWFAIVLHGVEAIFLFGGIYMIASGAGLAQ